MQVDACPWSPFGVQDLLGSLSAGKICGAGKAQDSGTPVKTEAQERRRTAQDSGMPANNGPNGLHVEEPANEQGGKLN